MLKHLVGLVATVSLCSGIALGHAGHDAIPEAATATVGPVAPRFYGVSDNFEGVLVFPGAGEVGDPTLYLTRTDTSEAVADATIAAEVITPQEKHLEVTSGTAAGTYLLHGIDAKTTATISTNVSAGDVTDILSFDNVIVEKQTAAQASAAATTAAATSSIPSYLIVAMMAAALVLMIANVAVLMAWFSRNRRSGPGNGKNKSGTFLLIFMLAMAGAKLRAHAGEDHSGATLAGSAQGSSGAKHFVSIETQFQADILTTRVIERPLAKSFRALGQVEVRPDYEADVTPPAEGKLMPSGGEDGAMPVPGTTVTKNQVLLVLEQIIPATEKITLTNERTQVEAELAQAREELTRSTGEKQRAEAVAQVIAAKEVDKARADFKIAQDKVVGLEKRLATLTSALSGSGPNVRDIPVKSPISGVITQSHATNGEYVSTDKKLFHIVNLDELFVEADIFESDVAALRNVKTAHITVEAYPENAFHGTLQGFGQEVDPQRRTLRALFNVTNPEHLLRAGMFANVDIESGDEKPALLIPKSALFLENGVRQAFKKTAPETFVSVPVELNGYREDMAIVGRGLKSGDRIAVGGLYQIRMAPIVGGAH